MKSFLLSPHKDALHPNAPHQAPDQQRGVSQAHRAPQSPAGAQLNPDHATLAGAEQLRRCRPSMRAAPALGAVMENPG